MVQFINPSTLLNGHDLFKEFKGSFIENYVAQSLTNTIGYEPNYWTSNRTAEVDYLIQYENNIIPVEVKSGMSLRSKSLTEYHKKYHPKIRIRLSAQNFDTDGSFINVPIFYADRILQLIDKLL